MLRPGIVIEVQVIKGNFIGRVQRYEVGRRGLAAGSRCLYPHSCNRRPPPGSLPLISTTPVRQGETVAAN
jgi:hypothetical protein